jgi:sphingolipid C9-methyltransferase
VSIHYAWTIKRWYDNWASNREAIVAAYGERWYRIWRFFLAWSTIIAEQGNAACFQVVLNKNQDSYDRTRWVKNDSTILGDRAPAGTLVPDKPQTPRWAVDGNGSASAAE